LEGMKILDLSKVIGVTAKLLDVPNKVREVYLNFRGNTLIKYYENSAISGRRLRIYDTEV
jgi:hypothetical protein